MGQWAFNSYKNCLVCILTFFQSFSEIYIVSIQAQRKYVQKSWNLTETGDRTRNNYYSWIFISNKLTWKFWCWLFRCCCCWLLWRGSCNLLFVMRTKILQFILMTWCRPAYHIAMRIVSGFWNGYSPVVTVGRKNAGTWISTMEQETFTIHL